MFLGYESFLCSLRADTYVTNSAIRFIKRERVHIYFTVFQSKVCLQKEKKGLPAALK